MGSYKNKAAQRTNRPADSKKDGRDKKKIYLIIGICAAVIALAAGLTVIFTSGGSQASTAATRYVAIEVKDYGTITAELYGDIAPVTVENFMKLVNDGFYDGLTFHRIISGFMIQGGDPDGNGTGGPGWSIKGEFSANGFRNDLKHERGVLSMARANDPDSAGSQFFIMHQDAPHLDGQYAAFGRVISGMEIVDAICADTPVTDRNGTVKAGYQPVILRIREIEKP